MKIILTKSQDELIRNNTGLLSSRKIAEQIGVSKFFILRFQKRHGLKPTKEQLYKMQYEHKLGQTTFTKDQDNFICQNYLKMPSDKIAEVIGKSKFGVRYRMKKLGLEIPEEIIAARKKVGIFKMGHTPFNKDKKIEDYLSPEAIEKFKNTSYKKGHLPHNTLQDLVITIRKSNSKFPYQFIRTSLAVWEPLHRYKWEQANGKIPKSHNLIFLDRNTMNTDLENLQLISNVDLMKKNSIHRYPEEIKDLIRITNKLNKTIKKVENGEK